jgi:hypothetical protein
VSILLNRLKTRQPTYLIAGILGGLTNEDEENKAIKAIPMHVMFGGTQQS